jgi:hypothetical protein
LFIESKLRGRHTVRTLHDSTKKQATREGKVPVLCLFDKSRPGFLIVVHSDDLATVAKEFEKARQASQDGAEKATGRCAVESDEADRRQP